jgi:hypothetical protein
MYNNFQENKPLMLQIAMILALAGFVVFTLFLWQGHKGFSLWDEGYLWYGAQRVILGEVPIRDFMSYDPGRYYWSAALMSLWDDNGIMALRSAVAIFQAIGLFVGLLLIVRSTKNWSFAYLLLSALTLAVWMFPRHKLFDISLSILLIGVMVFLIQKPVGRRYFLAGICVGLVAVFGRNHGMYGAVASLGVMTWLSIKRTCGPGFIEGFALWTSGVTAGFAPVLIMALMLPGFATAFWDSILFLFELSATNLPLPIPWPWRVAFSSVSTIEAIRGILVGLFFIGTVVFGVLSIAWVSWQKFHEKAVSPVLVAAAFLALPYAHYAYSRADVGHLAQGIFPLLLGCLVMLAGLPPKIKWSFSLMLCCASLGVMHELHPGWQCSFDNQCVKMEISGSELHVLADTADDVRLLRSLADEYAADGRSFIATPFWPGAYPLLGRKSPMWAIYALHPRNRAAQQLEIERIKAAKPGFILIHDFPLDGREELRFRNTHPLIHQFILDNFTLFPNSPKPYYQIFKSKSTVDETDL